jgi:phage-related holin
MSRFFTKIGRYGLALGTVWVLSAVEPTLFGWSFRYIGIFIILTELFSNFEKLALLGFKMPTDFLSRLNEDFKLFKRADEKNKKKIADDIILKGERKD